jgi:hypothetical protein
MKKKLPIFKVFTFLIFSLVLVTLLVLPEKVQAQDQGLSLRVSPPILEIDIEPGGTYSDYIKFENLDLFESLTLYPKVLAFKARGQEGGQEFIEDSEETETYSLSQWINISTDEITIEALERVVLPFTISVPEDAEPGGRYGAILLSNQPTLDTELANSVALGAQSGTIILARIEGDLYESAKINLFKTGQESYNYPPVDFEIVVENTGNVHIKPVGKIEIKNIFGSVVDEVKVNDMSGNVLPDSTRKFIPSWQRDKFTLGKYTANLMLEYGEESSQYLTDSIMFWVLPIKEIAIVGIVLLLVIILLIVIIKSYNRMIVKKAMKRQKELEQENQGSQNSSQEQVKDKERA